MGKNTNSISFERIAGRLRPRATPLRQGSYLIAALSFGGAVNSFGTDVAGGSNLTTYITNATPTANEFNLLGDVTMNGIGYLNNANRRIITIEGNNHTITKSANANIFWITGDTPNAFLTIRNANITSVDTGSSYGTISIDALAHNATIDLDGTRIYGTHGISGTYSGGLTTLAKNTVVKGNVAFDDNYGSGDAAGGVGVGNNAELIFEDQVSFSGNHTVNYGGAVSVYSGGSLTFKDTATFTGNYVTSYFGGALDIWNGAGSVVFEKDATFTGNYVKNTGAHGYGVRGGAIHIGYISGTDSPQLEMEGTSTFDGNYVWGYGSTVGVGGALALSAAAGDPLSSSQINNGFIYGASIDRGIFSNNYAYSDTGGGYGGAVFAKSYNSTLTFGSGSEFTGNMAKTLGGAIYFDQGTINLNGNVTFSGNRHGVTFSTAGNTLTPNTSSGSANAIYFAVSSNTATLNLNSGQGEVIHFADPIESAAGKTVTVNKTGLGTALFTEHNSDILAQTTVSQGTFELGSGVTYGRLGTAATSNFNLASGATLRGGAGATLLANAINLQGRIEVEEGEFNFQGSNVTLASTSVLALTINSIDDYSSINMNGNALALNNASLEITATNYVPSQNISDEFTLVSNLSAPATGMFVQGQQIVINGAEFEILYNASSISIKQLTVPEPSTYALILALGAIGGAWIHRRKKGSSASSR